MLQKVAATVAAKVAGTVAATVAAIITTTVTRAIITYVQNRIAICRKQIGNNVDTSGTGWV